MHCTITKIKFFIDALTIIFSCNYKNIANLTQYDPQYKCLPIATVVDL